MAVLLRLFAFCVLAALQACGGGSGGSAPADASSSSAPLLNSVNAAAIQECPTGGATITSGLDANRNGVLDSAEISSRQNVCNGVNGASGSTTLIRASTEPAGTNCANGGYRIDVGADTSGNSVLDLAEVTSTAHVCNGAAGTGGATGATGLNSLITITSEPVSANCANGGSRVSAGLDSNANGSLDAAEVTGIAFVCNGPPGPGVVWNQVVGTAVQALPNNGYIANDVAQVVITLPDAPPIGSIVRVSGAGSGGWRLAQNAGQSILLPDALNPLPPGVNWTLRDSARNWFSVASSADGSKLVAAELGGHLYTSADSGQTWTAHETFRFWFSVASSADGSKLVAADRGGRLYTSADSGQTWVPHDTDRLWFSVASSADGRKLAAAEQGGPLYTSADSGQTWVPRNTSITQNWTWVASSADGNKLVAASQFGQLYTSTDSGQTWVPRDSARNWTSVASSADGSKLVAAASGGNLYTSTDSGETWIPRDSSRSWSAVASSADGSKLVAAVSGGNLYTSTDSGETWIPRDSSRGWRAVASSADGNKLVATELAGLIYTSTRQDRTTAGVTGFVSGRQFDALELMYTGGGLFVPLSYSIFSHVVSAN